MTKLATVRSYNSVAAEALTQLGLERPRAVAAQRKWSCRDKAVDGAPSGMMFGYWSASTRLYSSYSKFFGMSCGIIGGT